MADTVLYFKWTGPHGEACNGGSGIWPLPEGDGPGEWMPPIKGEIIPCERGYHLCRAIDVPEWRGNRLWVVETGGDIVDGGNKVVCGEARLLREIPVPSDRMYRLFAADCAERVVHLTGPDERCITAIAVARRYANGEATDEELAAARAAAWDAARAAAPAAAWDAAWDAARAAAPAAAGDAARAAARAAAPAAAWDAARAAAPAAAWDAARAAERSWQNDRFEEYLTGVRS